MTPDQTTELRIKVAELQTALLAAHPTMPVLLRTIHSQLRKDPEIVTIMSAEEIGTIVNALKVQTRTEISTTVAKTTAASIKKQIAKGSGSGSAVDLF